MQKGWSYIKDSGDFINKTKNVSIIPDNAILVTGDVVGLYPSIPHEAGLRALRETLDKQDKKCIPTEDLVKMAEFVLKNNFFEFNCKIKQRVLGTAIDTKFAPPYACLFMDKFETSFLETQQLQPLVWFRYIDDIFFIWTHGEEELKFFLKSLNEFDPWIKFTYESNKESIAFLDTKVSLRNGKVLPKCTLNLLTVFNIYIICLLIHTTLKSQLSLARLYELVGYAVQRRILKIIKNK